MKIIINNKFVEQTTLGNELVWIESGTTNIIGKVADISNKYITYDCDEDKKIIGSRLRSARESKGLTITQFSAVSGITRANLNLIENGVTSVGISIYIRLCASLGIKLADIMQDLP